MRAKNLRRIDYFGIELIIDNSFIKYIATNPYGEVCGYSKKPHCSKLDNKWWPARGSEWHLLAKVDLEGTNWTETLVCYKNKKVDAHD